MALVLILSFASCLLLTLFASSVKETQFFAGKDTLFFYLRFQRLFIQRKEAARIFVALRVTRILCFFFYAFSLSALVANWFTSAALHEDLPRFIIVLILALTSLLLLDILPSIAGYTSSEKTFRLTAPFASLLLILFSPFHFLVSALSRKKSDALTYPHVKQGDKATADKVLAALEGDGALGQRSLLRSVLDFKDRIVREVMVPRVDLFTLPAKTLVSEAKQAFIREGYSRIPIYGDNIDDILGIVMAKDLLHTEGHSSLTLEKFLKPILFVPETKRCVAMLQDFRAKQMHMAVVVDEWGGTEGLVTIEDILEEIVGEIADEYDVDEKRRLTSVGEDSWTVDPKMSLVDVEEWFGVHIPQEGDYDTIGGYIIHKAGAIPQSGFRITQDTFDIEVLSATERAIVSLRLSVHKSIHTEEEDG